MDMQTLIRKQQFAKKMRYSRSTHAENVLAKHLSKKQSGTKFKRQVILRGWIVDFYAPEYDLIIEVDGSIHDHQKEHDRIREDSLVRNGYCMLRFSNQMVIGNPGSVVETIYTTMKRLGRKRVIYRTGCN